MRVSDKPRRGGAYLFEQLLSEDGKLFFLLRPGSFDGDRCCAKREIVDVLFVARRFIMIDHRGFCSFSISLWRNQRSSETDNLSRLQFGFPVRPTFMAGDTVINVISFTNVKQLFEGYGFCLGIKGASVNTINARFGWKAINRGFAKIAIEGQCVCFRVDVSHACLLSHYVTYANAGLLTLFCCRNNIKG